MADYKLYADFWLLQRVSSPRPVFFKNQLYRIMQIIILTVLNSYIKSLLAGIFWHVSELKSTCNIQITHFCSAKRLIFNISSSPHPHLDRKRSWYHIDQKVKSNILWKNPNRFFGQPGISSIGKFSGFVTADLLWWLVAGPWIRRRGPSSSSWSSVSRSSMQPWGPTSDSAVTVPQCQEEGACRPAWSQSWMPHYVMRHHRGTFVFQNTVP